MTLFVLSERAVAASKPKKTTEIKNEPEELSFNSMPEQLLHLENLNGKSEVYIIKNLLSSDELVPFEIEKNSTWASSPKTIKAFTAYKIAVLISGDHFFQEKIQEFKNHKIHDLLIDMLNSADIGDVENSLLAIVYICEKCKKMQKAFFESHLFDHLKKKILTARTEVALTGFKIFRIIYKNRNAAKEEFIRLNLTFELIKLIKSQNKDHVIEGYHCITDLIMKDENILNKGLLLLFANQGLFEAVSSALALHGSDNKIKLQLKCLEELIKSL